MPAPTILKRNLTFHFPRSVSVTNQRPQAMEVIIVPLSDPSGPDQGTYVGGLQTQSVLLDDDDNTLTFMLVPTASPDLVAPVTYRVAWREGGILGRTVTYDFAMPDADVRFDELAELGQIVGGETYLQQSDLGVPGRVAKLNDDGVPVDSDGHPAAGAAALDSLANMIDDETSARMSAVATAQSHAQQFASAQVLDLAGQVETDLDELRSTLTSSIDGEILARSAGVAAEQEARIAADTALDSRIDTLSTTLSEATITLASRASLDNTGRVPISQIPPAAITSAVSVSTQDAMLALTTDDVQPGDLAVRPDGVFGLYGPNPAELNNWVPLTKVSSVNGYQGAVSLTSADVGAIATGTELPISQIAGLSTALDDRATVGALNAVSATVDAIQGDATLVRTVEGVVPHLLLDSNVAYVNGLSQVTLKDGTVIASGTGDVFSVNGMSGAVTLDAADVGALALGAELPISEITGLQAELDGKVGLADSRLTDDRTPTAHAASHGVGEDDAITIAVSQVTGLSTTLGGLTTAATTTALGNRVSVLENTVTELQGTPGGAPVSKDVWWDSATALTDISTAGGMAAADVRLKSPFGQAEDGSYYYDPEGANEDEVVWPYLTPNGHLQFRVWNESADADIVYAPQSALDTTNDAVALKASQVDLDSLNLTVSTKAAQTDVAALQAAMVTKASQSAVNALNTTVASLAQQSQVDALATAVAGKASQTDFAALSASVSTKASQAEMDNTNNTVAALVSGQTTKADLLNGVVPLAQIPAGIPQDSVSGLSSTLEGKADLVNGKLNTDQVPSIPIDTVTNLSAALASKADLVNGKLATSQLPALSTHETFAVANRASMLALTGQQAQIGDQCIITSGADQGTYTLIGEDPSQFTNWLLNTAPSSPVTSINGRVGNVVLSATDVGAYPSSAPIPQASVAGLADKLATLATTTDVISGLSAKTSPDAVRLLVSQTSQIKRSADYVATTPLPNLYGTQQIVDGIIAPLNSVVLVTAQSSSTTNGLYKVASTEWVRVTDMATASYFITGTLAVVTRGSLNANTVWQLTSPSGTTGTDANNWSRVLQAGPPVGYQGGHGLSLENGVFTVVASTAPGAGIAVTPQGLRVDQNVVARKFTAPVSAGSTTVTVPHNLGTLSPMVQVIGGASGEAVLVGWTVTGPNTVSLEFAAPVVANDWRVVVIG